VVPDEWLRRGVGPRLIHELVQFGRQKHGVEILFAQVLPEQTELIRMLEQAGCTPEATHRRFAKHAAGTYHDVIIMSNDLEHLWRQLEEQLLDLDTPALAGNC
jgi:RimJ/RimL family protein N-acetyltransferase